MKKAIFTIILLAAALFTATAAQDHDYAIPFEQLPAVSQTFVSTHFPKAQVAYCLRDSHSFEARLSDASEIEFNLDGSWKEVDCKYRERPSSVIGLLPATIPSYVKTNFPNAVITKVSSKFWGYELELNNGLDLEFATDGRFLKIDD